MNKIITICLVALTSIGLNAQSIERQVVASSGTTLSNASVSLDFTVGELVVTTITDGTNTLTQGFHQPEVVLAIKVDPIAFLEASYTTPDDAGLMNDDLRDGSYIPTTSPYADAITCAATVLNLGGTSGAGAIDDDIVDWIWVELRDDTDNTIVIASQSALLQRDGDIVDVDGLSTLTFDITAKDYYISVNHRNHLGVMTANTFALSSSTATVDFTAMTGTDLYDDGTIYDGNEQKSMTGENALLAGDANSDGQVGFNNGLSDLPKIQLDVLLHPGNAGFSTTYDFGFGYYDGDVNMDGQVGFANANNDVTPLQLYVLLYPLNTGFSATYDLFLQQLP